MFCFRVRVDCKFIYFFFRVSVKVWVRECVSAARVESNITIYSVPTSPTEIYILILLDLSFSAIFTWQRSSGAQCQVNAHNNCRSICILSIAFITQKHNGLRVVSLWIFDVRTINQLLLHFIDWFSRWQTLQWNINIRTHARFFFSFFSQMHVSIPNTEAHQTVISETKIMSTYEL